MDIREHFARAARPRSIAIVTAALLLAGVGCANAADLEPYVGKYPFGDKVRGRTLYQTPELKADFVAKFGNQRWTTVLGYHTAVPVEGINDADLGRVLVVSQCKPHDCVINAVLFLQPNATVLGVCFTRETRTSDTTAEWLGPGWRVEVQKRDCGHDAPDHLARFKTAAERR
jgi:hypothetical protein